RLPFDGATIGAVHAQILMEDPPPLRGFRPDVEPVLEAICLKALAKKPEDRHRSMAEVVAALKGYLENKTPAVAETAPQPATTQPAAPRPTSAIHASDLGGRSMVVAQREREERDERPPAPARDRRERKKTST